MSRLRMAATVTALILLMSSAGALADDWNPPKAAEYLDARQQDWTAFNAAPRGAGETRTLCFSCHTGVSYVLARPALRKAAGAKDPTAHEQRLASTAELRVARWADVETPAVELYYHESAAKKRESRGTEAILNALILALRDRADGLTGIRPTTKAALDILWNEQLVDGPHAGGWTWIDYDLQPWESDDGRPFGAALAAIAVASAPGYLPAAAGSAAATSVDRLRAYLRAQASANGQSAHHRAWLLWAGMVLPDTLSAVQRDAIAAALLNAQRTDGGWSLASLGTYQRSDGTAIPSDADGYATGLALIALQRAGRATSDPRVASGLAWLRTHQKPDGSWSAPSLNEQRIPATRVGQFMSDAATGLAAAALTPR